MDKVKELNIGEKIRKVRELKGYSQEFVSEQLDISQKAYSKIERNETKIDWGRITKIAEVLEISPIDLLNFEDNYKFNNCTQSGKFEHFYNQLPEKLIQNYEEQISHLKDEIAFLRNLLESKK
jgi:transcriptional regulator with XRE-family HTH domain